MAILQPILAITAILSTAQSLYVLPPTSTVTEATPVIEKRWMETNCVSTTLNTTDYSYALSSFDELLDTGVVIAPQEYLYEFSGTAQVYICNNENYDSLVDVDSGWFNTAMGMLDNSCGQGYAGWIRDHRTNVDASYGRDVSSNIECGFMDEQL